MKDKNIRINIITTIISKKIKTCFIVIFLFSSFIKILLIFLPIVFSFESKYPKKNIKENITTKNINQFKICSFTNKFINP